MAQFFDKDKIISKREYTRNIADWTKNFNFSLLYGPLKLIKYIKNAIEIFLVPTSLLISYRHSRLYISKFNRVGQEGIQFLTLHLSIVNICL